jgi:hypothetical protein
MVRIAVTQEAFDAIVSTMTLGTVGFRLVAPTKPSGHLIVPPKRRLLHYHIPCFVQISDQPLRHDVSVQAVGVMLRLTPLKPQRERE